MWSYLTSMFSSSKEDEDGSRSSAREDNMRSSRIRRERKGSDDSEEGSTSSKREQPPLAHHDATTLDLAFVMDCTGSMGSYINTAKNNIRNIVEEIVAYEQSNINMALVEYRDHPPQDSSFVTRPHDFTPKISKMKSWLEECSASGGGDGPEAVADGLHQLLKLSWRADATKIAVLISDAPPHGLGGSGDGFPNGCPDGLDPMEIADKLAEKGVTLYVVGCEPSINAYKDFFMGLAYLTGGQYVPLAGAKALTQVIIGGAQEEMSLEQWMDEVNKEVEAEVQAKGAEGFDDETTARRLTENLNARGVKVRQVQRNAAGMGDVTEEAKKISGMKNLAEIRKEKVVLGSSYGSGASASDSYNISTIGVEPQQALRMVQKAKMRNKSWFS